MGKKRRKGKSQAKPKAAATVKRAPEIEYSKSTSAASSTPTSKSQSEEDFGREPTEAEVVSIMHDDDLLEYSSSNSSSNLRRKSMFEFYKQQWKAARAATERSRKVEVLRESLNSAPNTPATKPPGMFAKFRAASKLGTIYLLDWVLLAIIVGAALAFGGVAMTEAKYILADILFLLGIGLFIGKAAYDQRNHELKTQLMLFFIILGVAVFLLLVGWGEWDRRHEVSAVPLTTTIGTISPSLPATQTVEQARDALRAESFRPLRDVAFHIKLNRPYSIAEIGHFRISFEVFDNNTLDWFIGCQDLYRATYDEKENPYGSRADGYGYRCAVQYRVAEQRYTPIPLFPAKESRRYTSLSTPSESVDNLEYQIDLHNQIPTYKTLEDLDRKNLYIFVTETIADKIASVSFEANRWELISAPANKLSIIDDKPIAPWFLPLLASERAIRWKGVYLKPADEMLANLPPNLREKRLVDVWPLDFAIIHPRKLPEPEVKVDPLK